MNGIDPLIVATGNDWRAIEAGAHVWAVRKGHYTSLTTWEKDGSGRLIGTLELPMAVGIVGGATKTHPLAKLALKILNIHSAAELAQFVWHWPGAEHGRHAGSCDRRHSARAHGAACSQYRNRGRSDWPGDRGCGP